MNRLLTICVSLLTLCSCATLEDYDNTAEGNFNAVWTALDEHYCFFEEKDIDWQEVKTEFAPLAAACKTTGDLFEVCSQMLETLRDGHVNLISSYATSYYKNWWTDYPQDFNLRTIQQYYLDFDYRSTGAITYKKIADDRIGYIYYSTFSSYPSASALDGILAYFNDCEALIIDIRNNGGGLLTSVDAWVGRFIETEFTGGYIRHKTGPGHTDFSEPYPIVYAPAGKGRVKWTKPIAVLTNRSCFSAANDFVCVMKQLPQVSVIGSRTGGGGGLPFSSETPCGWSIRFSASPVSDPQGKEIESGIDPSAGCEVHASDTELASGRDAILDFAISHMLKQ